MSVAAPEHPRPAPMAKTSPAGSRERQAQIALFPATEDGGEPTMGIVKHSRHGLIRNVLTRIRLRPEADEVWHMNRWNPSTRQQEPVYGITAVGYDRLNQHAGVSFVTPETLVDDDGTHKPNPFLARDPKTREILYVRLRLVGIGRNSLGNLMAHDYTLSYDLNTYLSQDLWSKFTGRKSDAVKDWGRVVAGGTDPKCEPHEKAYNIPAGVTLVVDLSHKDVLAILSEHISRQKFAERNAATICRRNVLKKFIGATRLDRTFTVPVVAWAQADRDLVELGDMVSRANTGEVMVDNEAISIERVAEVVDDKDEIDAALHGDVDEEQAASFDAEEMEHTPGVDAPPAAAEPATEDPRCAELRAKIRDAWSTLGDDAADVLVDYRIDTPAKLNDITDPAKLAEIEKRMTDARLRKAQSAAKAKQAPRPAGGKSATEKPAGSLLPDGDTPKRDARKTGDPF